MYIHTYIYTYIYKRHNAISLTYAVIYTYIDIHVYKDILYTYRINPFNSAIAISLIVPYPQRYFAKESKVYPGQVPLKKVAILYTRIKFKLFLYTKFLANWGEFCNRNDTFGRGIGTLVNGLIPTIAFWREDSSRYPLVRIPVLKCVHLLGSQCLA